jgi:hypothetical protein
MSADPEAAIEEALTGYGVSAADILDALRAAGYTVVMSVEGAARAVAAHRLAAFGRDCVTHGDMTPGAERMLNRILDGETA